MKTQRIVPTVNPSVSFIITVAKSEPRPVISSPEKPSQNETTSHSIPEARHPAMTMICEEIRRRCETPFRLLGWEHSGLND
jgi:hypothetical protein